MRYTGQTATPITAVTIPDKVLADGAGDNTADGNNGAGYTINGEDCAEDGNCTPYTLHHQLYTFLHPTP